MDAIASRRPLFVRRIRVGHEQNLALPHVAKRDLPEALMEALDKISVATPNVNLVSDIIACGGWTIARSPTPVHRSRRN
jgi:sulfite reductase (NADPH) hemoprotein beta-component